MTKSSSNWRLGMVLAGWSATSLTLAAVGFFFFFYKTLVLPVFLAYALALPQEKRPAFLRAWLPFLAGTVVFDLVRGGIYRWILAAGRPEFSGYAIRWEEAVFGTPALPLVLQPFHHPWADVGAFLFHVAHFVYFLLIAILAWHVDERQGRWLQRALLAVMGIGLVIYALVPTVPPWLASERGLLPPIEHRVVAFYIRYVGFQLVSAFDTNPVAAMPSLHTAFPVACAIVGSLTFSKPVAALLWLYALLLTGSIVYLGEHYGVDVIAGALTAAIAVWATAPRRPLSQARP